MKLRSVLTSIAIASLPLATAKSTEEKSLKEKAAEAAQTAKEEAARLTKKVVEQTRESWRKSKAYLSEVAATHREGAVERLKELDREIGELEAESKSGKLQERVYFKTRVMALAQHHDYALKELERLPKDKEAAEYARAREEFDNTLEDLENAIAEARRETRNEP